MQSVLATAAIGACWVGTSSPDDGESVGERNGDGGIIVLSKE